MRFWHSAFDQAKRREFKDVLGSLSPGLITPFSYSGVSDIAGFIKDTFDTPDGMTNVVLSLPAKQQFYIDNACIATAKFAHVVDCVRADYQRGALTWCVLEAHHAALFGTRALAALFGITVHRVLGRSVLVDFWPEFGTPDHVRAFGRRHRTVADPVRVMMPSEERLLEQQHTWLLLQRLLGIIKATSVVEGVALSAAEAVGTPSVSHIRNEVLYHTSNWPSFGDIQLARFFRKEKLEWLDDTSISDPDLLTLVDAQFCLCRTYIEQLLAHIGNRRDDVHFLLKLNVNERVYAA